MFGFSSTTLTLKQETLVYPTESFIAEVGGSLGLFVGFSFLNLWDYLLTLLICSLKCHKKIDVVSLDYKINDNLNRN